MIGVELSNAATRLQQESQEVSDGSRQV
jgi:hypothetical protein